MLNQFTDEYKQIMLDAENRAKKFGHKNILPEDVLLQISRLTKGNIAELLQTLGVNESLILDIFSRPPFWTKELENRDGDYIGISERLRELIVASLRMAASFHKPKAGVEDFLLALIQSPDEKWFVEFLDFVGVNVNMFERQVTNFNHLTSPQGMKNFPMNNQDPIFGPIDEIMDMIEDHFGNQNPNINQPMDTPFAHNAPQEKNESRTPALDFFGTDLVAEAKTNKLDPVIGRNTEIDRLISILNRKTKNNPCLVGEPGVGKTAVVEGLARRIASADVPFAMQNKRIVMLDLPGMLAGTKYRGEFENRIKMIIEEASTLENEVILFIDEIHRLRPQIEEILYSAMEDFQIDIIIGSGTGATSVKMDIPKFTLVGATTKLSSLSHPLRDRFGNIMKLDFYDEKDLEKIIARSFVIMDFEKISTEAIESIAKRSRGTPRIANRYVKIIRDYAIVGNPVETRADCEAVFTKFGVDVYGLDILDKKLLQHLYSDGNPRVMGLTTLASLIGEEVSTIEDIVEPYLLQIGFIERTPRGRQITTKGVEYLKNKNS